MDGLVFANKLLQLVTAADYNSTHKMATTVALLQVAQEHGPEGSDLLPTERIAEVVIDLYPRHARHGSPPLTSPVGQPAPGAIELVSRLAADLRAASGLSREPDGG